MIEYLSKGLVSLTGSLHVLVSMHPSDLVADLRVHQPSFRWRDELWRKVPVSGRAEASFSGVSCTGLAVRVLELGPLMVCSHEEVSEGSEQSCLDSRYVK